MRFSCSMSENVALGIDGLHQRQGYLLSAFIDGQCVCNAQSKQLRKASAAWGLILRAQKAEIHPKWYFLMLGGKTGHGDRPRLHWHSQKRYHNLQSPAYQQGVRSQFSEAVYSPSLLVLYGENIHLTGTGLKEANICQISKR